MDTADTQEKYIITACAFVCRMLHHRPCHPATAQAVTQHNNLVAACKLSQESDPDNPDDADAADICPANM